jgi:RNA polymerase sigma-70 factor (ECF subfamily)
MVVARVVRRRAAADVDDAEPDAAGSEPAPAAAPDEPAPGALTPGATVPDEPARGAPTPIATAPAGPAQGAPTPIATTTNAPAQCALTPDATTPDRAARGTPPPSPDRPSTTEPPPPAPSDLDELTLVVRAQEGDTAAFEALARRHQAALYRLAVRVVGDPVEAEDALQEALLDGWRRIGRFRADAAFSTWMYRIVTNRCLSQLRRRRPEPVAEVDERVPAPDDPGRSAEVDAGLAALGRALQALPAEQRVCWVLRELEGLGYAEISEITGASEHAVRGRIHRARTTLAGVMRPWR